MRWRFHCSEVQSEKLAELINAFASKILHIDHLELL